MGQTTVLKVNFPIVASLISRAANPGVKGTNLNDAPTSPE